MVRISNTNYNLIRKILRLISRSVRTQEGNSFQAAGFGSFKGSTAGHPGMVGGKFGFSWTAPLVFGILHVAPQTKIMYLQYKVKNLACL